MSNGGGEMNPVTGDVEPEDVTDNGGDGTSRGILKEGLGGKLSERSMMEEESKNMICATE